MLIARKAFLAACAVVGVVLLGAGQGMRSQAQTSDSQGEKIKPAPSPSAADILKKYRSPVNITLSPKPVWRGSEVDLAALKAKIRKAIRENEGRDINLEDATINSANKGDTATGKISYESDGGEEIVIDTDPCSDVMSQFRKPYEKQNTGAKVSCGNKEFSVYTVEQK